MQIWLVDIFVSYDFKHDNLEYFLERLIEFKDISD